MSEMVFGPVMPSDDEASRAFTALAKDYPAVAQVLQGRTKEMKGGIFPPCTIMLSMDSGVLKFCCSPKYGAHVCFGTIDDPSDLMGSLELSIRNGKVDWRPRKNQK